MPASGDVPVSQTRKDGVTVLTVGDRRYRVLADGELVEASSFTEKLCRAGEKVDAKSPEQTARIGRALSKSQLLRSLDAHQHNRFVKRCVRLRFKAGERVLAQGEPGDNFYILDEGTVQVEYDPGTGGAPIVLSRLHPGQSFGEHGVVKGSPRSATMRCTSDVSVWAVDRPLLDGVLRTPEQLALFESKASVVNEATGERSMSLDDFVRMMSEATAQDAAMQRNVRELFGVLSKRADSRLSFADFALCSLLLRMPDAASDIAFLLFDRRRQGQITLEDFRAAMSASASEGVRGPDDDDGGTIALRMDCDLIRRFFGESGERVVRAADFGVFLVELHREIAAQAFEHYDPTASGFVSRAHFVRLLRRFGGWRMPGGVLERLERHSGIGDYISYAEFVAFNDFLDDLPAIVHAVRHAGAASLTRAEFRDLANRMVRHNMSALEVDTVFKLLADAGDGCLRVATVLAACAPPPESEAEAADPFEPPVDATAMTLRFLKSFTVGAVAGGLGTAFVYPIDTCKTRMQAQVVVPGQAPQYSSALDCFRQVWRAGGVRGLFRGCGTQMVGIAPEKAIKLSVNDLLRRTFDVDDGTSPHWPLEILAGAGAGASQVVISNPIEAIKVRQQTTGGSTAGIVRELGLRGLFRGVSACLMRDVPFSAIYFPGYQMSKAALQPADGGELQPHHLLVAGAVGGVPAAALTTPFDVLKTRLQVAPPPGAEPYRGVADCAQRIVAEEGAAALFRGAGLRVMRSSPQFAVTLVTYELLHRAVAPDAEPRPPTNAPLPWADYEVFRRSATTGSLRGFAHVLEGLDLRV